MNPVLVELSRGERVESWHRGAVAVADAAGRLVWSIGDVERLIYPRSALKMLQALPLVETGAADAYGLSNRELALACASHSGEAFHVETVAAWLHKIGCSESDLACGPPPGLTRAHHNCSGKHTGFLTIARHIGAPTDGYQEPDHPVQRLALGGMAEMAGVDPAALPVAIDGCTAPAAALSLTALATAMGRLADPAGLGEGRAAAARRLDAAVKAEPLYVAGTGRACTALIEAAGGAASVKTGAEGAYVAVISKLGLGVALKIDDGAGRGAETAIAAVLARLGVVDPADATVAALIQPPVTNSVGRVVGQRRPSTDLLAALQALDP